MPYWNCRPCDLRPRCCHLGPLFLIAHSLMRCQRLPSEPHLCRLLQAHQEGTQSQCCPRTRCSFAKLIVRSIQAAPINSTQVRFLNLQEFSSKGLMDQYGVRTQKWKLATTPEEALAAAKELKKSTAPPQFLENLHQSTAVISKNWPVSGRPRVQGARGEGADPCWRSW